MNSWDEDFWMDKFERGDVVIAPDEITFRAAEPYGNCSISFSEDGAVSYNGRGDIKFDSNKEVTATSNVSYALNKLMSITGTNTTSYATLDGLDNSCATPAHYNFGVKRLRRPITLNFCF